MFRFLSKLPSFFQAAKRFAIAAVRVLNVVVQVCDFTASLLQASAPSSVGVEVAQTA